MLNRKNRTMLFHDVINRSRIEPCRWQMQNNVKDAMLDRLASFRKCQAHTDKINSMVWSTNGELLLSASNDSSITFSNPFSSLLNRIKTPHLSEILCARFLPQSDHLVASGSRYDGIMCSDWSVAATNTIKTPLLRCYSMEPTKQILTIPSQPSVFVSCHNDKTVRLFDIRCRYQSDMNDCTDNVLIRMGSKPTSMALAPITQNCIAVGCAEGGISLYDRRKLATETVTAPVKAYCKPPFKPLLKKQRVTSLAYDENEQHILVNFHMEDMFLFDVVSSDGNTEGTIFRKRPSFANTRRRHGSFNVSAEDWQRVTQHVLNFTQNLNERERAELEEESNRVGGWEPRDEDIEMLGISDVSSSSSSSSSSISSSSSSSSSSNYTSNDEATGYDNLVEDAMDTGNGAGPCEIRRNESNNFNYVVQTYETCHEYDTCLTDVGFWGNNYVFAGSNCGYVFVWNKHKKDCVKTLRGNHELVSTVQPHPTLAVLAAGGSEGVITVFMPAGEHEA